MDAAILNVNKMTVYTKTGDDGTTGLFGGKRVYKSSLLIEAVGNIDELSSFIGLCISLNSNKDLSKHLSNIQRDLYLIMSNLSCYKTQLTCLESRINRFEKQIKIIGKTLDSIDKFVLPQGTLASSLMHVLRTVCRRAERSVVRLLTDSNTNNDNFLIIKYLNRLSDFFYILARKYNDKEILSKI